LIVDYNASQSSPAATIRGELAQGFAGGTWSGNGLTSSAAAANSRMAIGYGEASLLAPGGSFRSQPVDGTAVVAAYTLEGDANLNGTVDSSDFALLAAHYGKTNALWSDGDFNYDGVVNALDFNALAAAYGTHVTATASALTSIMAPAVNTSAPRSLFSTNPMPSDLAADVLT
jgi:hypothetical protein